MAKEDEPDVASQEQTLDIEQIKRQLELFDQRLDNIDSVVTAVVERVMKQPVTLSVTCPNCGKNIEVAIVGIQKPTG